MSDINCFCIFVPEAEPVITYDYVYFVFSYKPPEAGMLDNYPVNKDRYLEQNDYILRKKAGISGLESGETNTV